MLRPVVFALPIALALSGCRDLARPEPKDPALMSRIAELKARIAQQPNDAKLLVELGQLQDDANLGFEAADTLLEATKKDAKSAAAHASLALVYTSMGYFGSAVEQLRSCMTIDRRDPDCLFAVGSLFENDNSQPGLIEARRAYKQLLEIAPDYPQATLVRSRLEQLDGRLPPDTGTPPQGAASQPAAEGDQGGRAAEGQPGQGEMPPGHPQVDAQAGAPSGEMPAGHPATAQGGEGGAANVPGHPGSTANGPKEGVGALNAFGQVLKRAFDAVKRNDAPAAEAAYREALKLRENDPSATAGLAQALLQQNKTEEAVQLSEALYMRDPGDVQSRWTFGMALVRSGRDVARGISLWESIQKDDPAYAKDVKLPEELERAKQLLEASKGAKNADAKSRTKGGAKPEAKTPDGKKR